MNPRTFVELAQNFTDAVTTFNRNHAVFLCDVLSNRHQAASVFVPAEHVVGGDQTGNLVEELESLTAGFNPGNEDVKERLIGFRAVGLAAITHIAYVAPVTVGAVVPTTDVPPEPDKNDVELRVMFYDTGRREHFTPVYEGDEWQLAKVLENPATESDDLPDTQAAVERFALALSGTAASLRDDIQAAKDGTLDVKSEKYRAALNIAKDEHAHGKQKGPIVVHTRLVIDGTSMQTPVLLYSDRGNPTMVIMDDAGVIKLMKSCLSAVAETADKTGLMMLNGMREMLNSPMVSTVLNAPEAELDDEARKFIEALFGEIKPTDASNIAGEKDREPAAA